MTNEFLKEQLELLKQRQDENSDVEWQDIADFRYKNNGISEHRDTIRKGSKLLYEYLNSGWIINPEENDINKEEIDTTGYELQLIRDERNELNRLRREYNRTKYFTNQVIEEINNHKISHINYDENKQFTGVIKSDNDLLISFTDVHCGIMTNENLINRINRYLDKIFEVQLNHGSENAYVCVSELLSGIIHNTLRIESNMNVIQQFLTATDYLSEFIEQISYRFNKVYVSVCCGNHSRLFEKKENNLRGENFDFLIIPFLKAKLQNFKNINYIENIEDETISIFDIRGNTICSTHGDRDNIDTIVDKLTLYLRKQIDIILVGHKHTNALLTQSDTKVIQAGSFTYNEDSYAKDKRLRNRPEQVIAVINSDGLDCFYDVKLQ